ncbi:hypothetical protein Q8A67_009739 [Cirrhinus molitorella]|uniref:Uncharacterized protein n=1 Tax=Cirrhinus molitorella TaxID=172907 RepID=A0AA88TPU0_9TELE|nr:hypothetical protein Q8A67_009739 [Cirrhinus molitorella]
MCRNECGNDSLYPAGNISACHSLYQGSQGREIYQSFPLFLTLSRSLFLSPSGRSSDLSFSSPHSRFCTAPSGVGRGLFPASTRSSPVAGICEDAENFAVCGWTLGLGLGNKLRD